MDMTTMVKDEKMIIYLSGEIDHHTAREIRDSADRLIISHRPATFILDLAGVDFMDSSGLGLILGRYTRMIELGGNMILVEPTRQIEKILALAAMDKTLPIEKKSVKKGKTV